MSDLSNAPANETSATDDPSIPAPSAPPRKSMPNWFISGVLGILIGGIGGFLLAKYGYGHRVKILTTPANAGESYGKPPMMGAPAAGGPEAHADSE